MDLQYTKMELNRKFLIIHSSFRQFVLSFPVLFLIFLLVSLTIPESKISRNSNYPQKYKNQKIPHLREIKPRSIGYSLKKPNILKNGISAPDLSKKQISHSVKKLNQSYFEKKNYKSFNESMRRIILTFLQFENISIKRFNRGTTSLPSQASIKDLADHIFESRWYREAIWRFSSNEAYGFSEERLLRVLFSIQVSSHSFKIPFPALFCLFFQESKFDFLANSHTGAKGIGQLTSIGIREIRRLRNDPEKELLLQKTVNHLNQVYADPQINLWLENLGFDINLPKISQIPKKIEFTKINSAFMHEVGKELVKNGHSYGENIGLLWYLSKKIRRGRILSERYAHTHKVFSQMLENRYANSPASAYNIETNILVSTILFNHYYRYKWQKDKEIFNLSSDARVIAAAAAYNHGQSGMRRFLKNLKQEFPLMKYEELSAKKISDLLTIPRLSKALQRPFYKIRETARHINKIMECTKKRTLVL